MSEPTDKCANPVCHCPAEMDSGYCGEHCENAELELGCHCGHAECEQRAEAISQAD